MASLIEFGAANPYVAGVSDLPEYKPLSTGNKVNEMIEEEIKTQAEQGDPDSFFNKLFGVPKVGVNVNVSPQISPNLIIYTLLLFVLGIILIITYGNTSKKR